MNGLFVKLYGRGLLGPSFAARCYWELFGIIAAFRQQRIVYLSADAVT